MSSSESDQIAGRTVRGSAYSVAASAVTIVLGFVRTTLMLRFLTPDDYGVTTLALLYLNLAAVIRNIGIDNAMIHRPEEEGIDELGYGTYFTLKVVILVGGLVILTAFIPLLVRFYDEYPLLGIVLLAFVGIEFIKGLSTVQVTLLSKQLAFRQLSFLDVASSLAMTVVGPWLAWQGFGAWSIVGERFSGIITRFALSWTYYRAWRPRFGWDGQKARWFLSYGAKVWISTNLTYFVDRFDDFWVGTVLGKSALGFYSRAYEYAGYSRKVVANPLLSVFFPTFASLQADKIRLSRAFFRATSLMVRVGCLFSLLFIFTAPEFIPLLLTERWLPMLLTFQLMIVYTLLEPLSMAARNLLMATGHPGATTRIRFVQTVVFVPSVMGLGMLGGIEGVALAADIMVLVGAVLLFRYTTFIIDYSQRALWFWPMVSLTMTATAVILLGNVWAKLPAWWALSGKLALIAILYPGILLLTEREQLTAGWQMIWGLIRPKNMAGGG